MAVSYVKADLEKQIVFLGKYTVVIVTHNLAQARRIANYAGFFWIKDQRAGCLIEFGQCKQIFEASAHELTAAYVNGSRGVIERQGVDIKSSRCLIN
ncbi:hypothetical protein ABXJ76_06690 [Methylobacter sp. G7]|uniref:hypothetical protein n=1 Tax=Methylobacter sp. G7 TaxID=3230117 RepID=UPI003D802F43